jgi:hypothetical protein
MEFITNLWLPICLSATAVFVVSSILHMMIRIHKGDYRKVPGESDLLAAMRAQGLKPGTYMFPCPGSMKEMHTPEMIEKYDKGPVGFMTVVPNGMPGIGKSLVQWFLYSVVISVFVAYIGNLAIDGETDGFRHIFRVTGTVAVLAYAFSSVSDSIWTGLSWVITAKFVFDGIVYGLVTGVVFGLLWS